MSWTTATWAPLTPRRLRRHPPRRNLDDSSRDGDLTDTHVAAVKEERAILPSLWCVGARPCGRFWSSLEAHEKEGKREIIYINLLSEWQRGDQQHHLQISDRRTIRDRQKGDLYANVCSGYKEDEDGRREGMEIFGANLRSV
ncbi:uncharacterized protein LOC123425518 isoform X3 [Hordeum vulgare subsp. vulgare]|uniref:uncharacterized protein LOC123425518 isoform X3 n=1 Tax=Hordeum vulgare subsp. vulgare TaxID=112509 RepID=UPI001D1A3F19|nr:uncharacterized protein LOC123425518 isoform X3 [Hordeum vulgare subsp. vulgare]